MESTRGLKAARLAKISEYRDFNTLVGLDGMYVKVYKDWKHTSYTSSMKEQAFIWEKNVDDKQTSRFSATGTFGKDGQNHPNNYTLIRPGNT